MTDRDRTGRRRFLALCGAAAVAGCVDDSGAGGTGTAPPPSTSTAPAGTDEPTADDSPAATRTPTEPLDLGEPSDWPMAGFDARNTGYNPEATGPTSAPDDGWRSDVAGYNTMAAPTFHDGAVYLASGRTAYALDPATGGLGWQADVAYLTHFTVPAVGAVGGEPTAFVAARTRAGSQRGGGSGRLYALAGADGATRWTVDLPVSGSPTLANGRVYIPETDGDRGRVHALDAATGAVAWTHDLSGPERTGVFGTVAVTDDAVYVPATRYGGTPTGELLVLAPADGTVRDRQTLPGELRSAPVVAADGTVYVATTRGVVAAFGPDGERWRTELNFEVRATPTLAAGTLTVLADRQVITLDAASGSRRWTTGVPPTRGSGLATDGEAIYVGGNRLTALDITDGAQRWAVPIPGERSGGWGSPVVVGEAVLAGVCIKNGENDGLYDDMMTLLV